MVCYWFWNWCQVFFFIFIHVERRDHRMTNIAVEPKTMNICRLNKCQKTGGNMRSFIKNFLYVHLVSSNGDDIGHWYGKIYIKIESNRMMLVSMLNGDLRNRSIATENINSIMLCVVETENRWPKNMKSNQTAK